LKGDIVNGNTVVIDEDFIKAVRIESEEVRPAAGASCGM
jgi:hypothetical protein